MEKYFALILLFNLSIACILKGNELLKSDDDSSKEGYINVPGGKVWFRIEGAGKKGIPLLVLHGGPGAPHDYLEPISKLADERPVIFYDQLGCGNSDRPSDTTLWNVPRFVEELSCVINELHLDKVHILGQSWGCMLAADYYLTKRSAEVVSMVFSGPCFDAERFVSDARSYLKELPEKLQSIISECEQKQNYSLPEYQQAVMEFYKLHVCRMDPWPECINKTFEKFGQEVYEHMWGPSEFTLTGTLKNYNRADQLNEIHVPVLLTCGRYDEAKPSTIEIFQKLIPDSKCYIFENASHMHHLEQEEEYLNVIRKFLKNFE